MDLRTSASGPGPVTITDSTAGLTVLFNVPNIGSNIYTNTVSDPDPLPILYPSGTLPSGLINTGLQIDDSGNGRFIGIKPGPFSASFTVVEN